MKPGGPGKIDSMSEVCNEVRFISQLALDGITLTRNAREKASQHREDCNRCMNFHQTLIQATALASDVSTEDVFNTVDLTAVTLKLQELIDSVLVPGSDEAQDQVLDSVEGASLSIECRLQALLGPCEIVQAQEADPAVRESDPVDSGQLISSVEKDGRLIETWLDKDGWTATRIRWLAPEPDRVADKTVSGTDSEATVRAPAVVESPHEHQTADTDAPEADTESGELGADDIVRAKQRHSIFELTEADVDAIFCRMLTSRSKERRQIEKPAIGFIVSPTALAELGRIATDKLDPMIDSKGCIRDLGKFLLDPEAVNAFENILKSREVNALINRLTPEQSAVLERLQSYMHRQHSVVGTLVVGRDGLVLSARYRSDEFSEELANWALCAYINSNTAAQLLNSKHLYHIILTNSQGDVIITDLGQSFLITVTEGHDAGDKEELMGKLETLLGK